MFEFWSLDNTSSKSILDVLERILFEISEDHSTESYSSQAWSVQWRWQLFLQCVKVKVGTDTAESLSFVCLYMYTSGKC